MTTKLGVILVSNMSEVEGDIEVSHDGVKSLLARLFSTYPIRLMRQENWMNHVSIVSLGFGGGIVSGDRHNIAIKLNPCAKLRYSLISGFLVCDLVLVKSGL